MVECNICGWTGDKFRSLYDDRNVLCPGCGAYERHRAMVSYLEHAAFLGPSGRVLEVGNGLIRAFRVFFERIGWTYVSLDLYPGFGDISGDAMKLPLSDGAFDLALCFHVLEHVEDDLAALAELARVVGPSGLAAIQVPYDDSRFSTRENTVPQNPGIAAKYYYDHRRDYGIDIALRCGLFWGHVAEIQPLILVGEATAGRHGFARNYGTTFLCSHAPPPIAFPGLMRRDLIPIQRREAIERMAYELSLGRNGCGSPLGDWLQAEGEVERLPDRELERLTLAQWSGVSRRERRW